MKVYLDVWCLNRLTDDQTQVRIREEADAIEACLTSVRLGMLEIVSSEALEDEARRNPSWDRRLEVETFLLLANRVVKIGDDLVAVGYGPYDALHIAAAESVKADPTCGTGKNGRRINRKRGLSWFSYTGRFSDL